MCLALLCYSIVLLAQVNQAAADAPNLDFSMGDFTNWKRYEGTFSCDDASVADPHKTYSYTWTEVNTTNRLTLMGNVQTLDPILQCDDLYCNPDPGKDVARIGRPQVTEGMRGSGCNTSYVEAAAEKLEYTYTITLATAILKYRFAAVLHIPDQGGDHFGQERPYFAIDVLVTKPDGTTAVPTCSSYQTVTNEASSTLRRGTSPCAASTGNPRDYMFQPWTSAMVDLRQFIGCKVTISVITHDCLVRCGAHNIPAAGGHEAYGYFRAEAMDLALSTKVCNQDDAQIAAPEGFGSYLWKRSDNFPIAANAGTPNIVSIPFDNMVPGITYTCTVSDELGCAAIDMSTQLNPVVLEPSFTYQVGCGGKVDFTSTATVQGDNLVNWIWNVGEGVSSGQLSDHTYAAPGDYDVTLTAVTSNGCKQSYTQTITVPYFPNLEIDATPHVCNGKELNVSVQNAEYGSQIAWSSSVAGQTFPTTASMVTTPTQSQRYTATVTDPRGCVYTADKEVLVFDTTRVYIEGDNMVCPTEPVQLTLIGSNLSDIRWNIPYATDATQVEVYPNETSLYYVQATDAHGCKVRAQHTIDVHPRPVVQVDAPAVCKGEDAIVHITGAQSYMWHDPSQSGNNSGDAVFENLTEDKGVLVTAYSEHACIQSTVISMRVKEKPVIEVQGETQRCFNAQPFELQAFGADSYVWNHTETTAYFTAPSDRNHRVTVTGYIDNCPSDPIEVNLTTLPSPTITAMQEAVAICEGDVATLQVTGADTYQWFNTTETSSTIAVSPIDNTIYTVKGISADGCLSGEIEIPVTVHRADQVNLRIEKSIACPGKADSVVLVADGALIYQWSSEPAINGIDTYSADRISLLYDEPTIVTVKGTNQYACSSASQITLTRLPVPAFEFKVEPTWIEADHSTVRFTGVLPADDVKWYWNTGDGAAILQARDTAYHYLVDNQSAPIGVEVTAIDQYGCRYQGEAEIKVWKEIWAPTAFTPNGDGLNDTFHFYGTHYLSDLTYYIYNRLGEVVFEGHSPTDAWDGTYLGQPCPWGVYGWVAHYKATISGSLREATLKGQVSIVK